MNTFKYIMNQIISFCIILCSSTLIGEVYAAEAGSTGVSRLQKVPITIICPSEIPFNGVANAQYNQDGWHDSPIYMGNNIASDPQAGVFSGSMLCTYTICHSDKKIFTVEVRISKLFPPGYKCERKDNSSLLCKPE